MLDIIFFFVFICLISLSNVQADWTEQECVNQWSRRLKRKGTFLASYANIREESIKIVCSYTQCRVGSTKWNECCKEICKLSTNGGINSGSDDFKDTQTGNKCCCHISGGEGKVGNCWLA